VAVTVCNAVLVTLGKSKSFTAKSAKGREGREESFLPEFIS
jgi:hypothetical protein